MKDSAKTILCYGDSNTWGAVPNSDDRYPRSVRWPGALQGLLGEEYEVISEGLNGRTMVVVDPVKPYRTGITHLQSILQSADPIDTVIVMLGTNDIKNTYNLSPKQIAEHLEQTISMIIENDVIESVQQIIIVCPPSIIHPEVGNLDERVVRGIELFNVLPSLYKEVAEKHGCEFLNAGDCISSSKKDGYHLDADSHIALANAIKGLII